MLNGVVHEVREIRSIWYSLLTGINCVLAVASAPIDVFFTSQIEPRQNRNSRTLVEPCSMCSALALALHQIKIKK